MTIKIMNRIAKEGLTPRNLERRRQFVQEWFGDCADLNLVGTVNEKDLGNSRPKEMEKYQSQRHGQKMINNTEAPVDENGKRWMKHNIKNRSIKLVLLNERLC